MGLDSLLQQNMQSAGLAGIDRLAGNAMFPQSYMDKTQYAVPSQMPTSAEVMRSDYDAPTQPYTGMQPQGMAKGGIATLRYNGEEDGSQVEAPQAWDPDSGTVKLQKLSDPNDPFSEVTTVDYTVPKDQIKNFAPDTDLETGAYTGGGAYVLNDGSTMRIDSKGIVQSATPGRNDYTLNKDGYYQPTGENLTWNGELNSLTKKIGGVDVNVPGMYHKGAYQNPNGELRVDANGVPVAVAPNYLDSGFGESWVSEYAPYMTAALLTAGAGMAAMPAVGAVEGAGALTTAELMGGAGGAFVPAEGASFMLPETLGSTGATLGSTAAPVAEGSFASSLPSTSWVAPEIGGTTGATGSTFGSLNAALPAAGAPGVAGGMSASLPTGAVLGTGLNGGEIGVAYMAGPNGMVATNSLGQPILASSVGVGGAEAAGGITAKQAMNLYRGANMLNSALGGGESQAGYGAAPNAAAPATIPTINRSGATGYYGAAEAPDYRSTMALQRTPYLSKLRNSAGPSEFAAGGIASLGGYSDGGQLLKGPGDGMSDHIPAKIGDAQPARLADGEFVVPADVVSHLGNGSTDAGAKQLYAMMDKVRKARTGNKKQGKQINPSKFLP